MELPLKRKPHPTDDLIEDLHEYMKKYGPTDPEYKDHLDAMERLTKLKHGDKPKRRKVSPDTILMVVGNLVGILLITRFEEENVLTSKGLGQILRPKSHED